MGFGDLLVSAVRDATSDLHFHDCIVIINLATDLNKYSTTPINRFVFSNAFAKKIINTFPYVELKA